MDYALSSMDYALDIALEHARFPPIGVTETCAHLLPWEWIHMRHAWIAIRSTMTFVEPEALESRMQRLKPDAVHAVTHIRSIEL